MMLDVIAFDADDTLWHNESLYARVQEEFRKLLSRYHSGDGIEQELYQTEMRNLPYYGYGIKSFALSMIETAVEVSGGRIQGSDVQAIIDLTKAMLQAPVQLFEGVPDVIASLTASYRLMLITKGDLLDQEAKLARSGLADSFAHVEIVSDKTPYTYQAILARHKVDPARFLMVGNSLRSDILPVVAIGGQAVYIPYHMTWAHEALADQDQQPAGYFELDDIRRLPRLVERLSRT
jgi:putative hydrolase of the HAD superfamily